MDSIEKEFNNLQTLFNEGKKYLIGKNKDIKLSIQKYEAYLFKLDNLYEDLKKQSNEIEFISKLKTTYINHISKLIKIFLLIPYYYKAKTLCEKILNIDKDNLDILPSYIKCLHYFKEYDLITKILNKSKSNDNDNDKIKELRLKNEERIKESKGNYNFTEIFQNFKKNGNFNLDLAEFTSDKICLQQDKTKGLIIIAKEDIDKGTLIIASKAIEYVSKDDNKEIKFYYKKEEYQKKLLNKLKDRMIYCKEDIAEIYELYDGTNGHLSLEERKQNINNILNNNNDNISSSINNMAGIFSNSISTKLYLYDELDLTLGIFYFPSFMSHSCVPNTKILGIGNFIFVFTEKKIKKNKEITTSYIDCIEEYKKRQEKLKKFYGFICECELCTIEKNRFNEISELKNKINLYINELTDLINSPNYDQQKYLEKANEITKFIDENNDKINNYEKGVLFYNLFCLWPYSDGYIKNYNLLQKGLEFCENENNLTFNILMYYFLLKMYKVNFVFNEKLCNDIRQKMEILFFGVLGDKRKEFCKILLDDLLNYYTSKEDNEIKGLKMIKFKEYKDLIGKINSKK